MSRLITFLFLLILSGAAAQPVVIPVVFHVVYNNAVQNLHDTILQEQLDVLNEDFNALNSDLWKVPSAWTPIIGNMNVQFVLANVDPNGNPTTGIERQQTTTTAFTTNDNVKYAATGGLNAWPDTSFLNIWVCKLSNALNGYTQFPGGPDATDGIVLDYRIVGRGSPAMAPFNRGRVGTHEAGHWFGLRHMGPDMNCADVDSISDTPLFDTTIYGGYAPFTVLTDACTPNAPGIMWMNFMSYVDDSSMVFFTQGQVNKMTWYLNNMRQGLLTPDGYITGIAQNIQEDQLVIKPTVSTNGLFNVTLPDHTKAARIIIYDVSGRTVLSEVISPGVRNGNFDLSGNADGIYSVLVTGEEFTYAESVILAQ